MGGILWSQSSWECGNNPSLTKGRTWLKPGKALLTTPSCHLCVLQWEHFSCCAAQWKLSLGADCGARPGQQGTNPLSKTQAAVSAASASIPSPKVKMKPGKIICEQAGVGAGGDWGGKSHCSFLGYGLEMCSMPFLPSDKKRCNQTNPKLYKQSKWSSSHCFSLHWLPKCFGHSLMRNGGTATAGRVQFPSELEPECLKRVISAAPESSLYLGKSRLGREV